MISACGCQDLSFYSPPRSINGSVLWVPISSGWEGDRLLLPVSLLVLVSFSFCHITCSFTHKSQGQTHNENDMLDRRNWASSREGVSMPACLCFHAGTDVRFLTVMPSPAPHVPDTSGKRSGCPQSLWMSRCQGLATAFICNWEQLQEIGLGCLKMLVLLIRMMAHLISAYSQFAPFSKSVILVRRGYSPLTPTAAFTWRCLGGADSANHVSWPAPPSSWEDLLFPLRWAEPRG